MKYDLAHVVCDGVPMWPPHHPHSLHVFGSHPGVCCLCVDVVCDVARCVHLYVSVMCVNAETYIFIKDER